MFIMNVWHIRDQALLAISGDLKEENNSLLEALALIDMGIERLFT
jgi:hypothetical protein